MTEVGDRVFAIRSGDSETKQVYVFGGGVYAGRFVPPAPNWPEGLTNPRIDLDNGDTTWGMECWWGPEEAVRARFPQPLWEHIEVKSVIGPSPE